MPGRPRGRHVRLDDATTYFLDRWPVEGPTPATVRTYRNQLRWLVRFAAQTGKTNLADLTPDLVRSAMAAKMATRRRGEQSFKGGEAAAHSLVMAARCMATWLRKQGVPVADLSVVKARKPPERVQPRVHHEEFQAIEQAILRRLVDADRLMPRVAIARDLALIHLLAETGLRASEVCGMTVDAVNFEQGTVLVYGKGRKERELSIVDPDDPRGGLALKLLAEWIRARTTIQGTARHDWLWVSLRGNPLSVSDLRDSVIAPLCREAGLSGNRPPHAFRRFAFTESYLADPKLVNVLADRMGWSDKSRQDMINVYTRGAKVELARSTPIPSVVGRWTAGVGPPSRARQNGRAAPTFGKRDATTTALPSPRTDRRLPS